MIDKNNLLHHKRVAVYITIPNHYSLLEVILRSLEPFDCKITLFISEELNKLYALPGNIEFIHRVSSSKWMKRYQIKILNDQDFIIFDQLSSFRELLLFAFTSVYPPRLMILHDCHTWFKPSLPKGLKNSLKYLFTKKVKNKFCTFAVAGSNMKRYLERELTSLPVFLVPFRYAEYDPKKDVPPVYVPGSVIKIGVPGLISNRRNYHKIIDELCVPKLKDKIILHIMGEPIGDYGAQIIKKLKTLRSEGYQVKFSEEYISIEDFERNVQDVNILFSDFDVAYTTNNGQKEIYGISKETGVACLMLNKAKVGLLPAEFRQMDEIRDQTLFYNTRAELQDIILAIYNNEIMLNKLQERAVANANRMSIKDISDEILSAYKIQLNGNS